jgi:putative membrane protein
MEPMEPMEPNPKPASTSDYLAAERTLLAWIRTSLAFMGFGFVVARFGLFLRELRSPLGGLPGNSTGASLWFGITLIASGVLLTVFSGVQHLRLVRALGRGEGSVPHGTTLADALVVLLTLAGIGIALYLFHFNLSLQQG